MSDFAASLERSAFGRRFRFRENGTTPGRDTVAGRSGSRPGRSSSGELISRDQVVFWVSATASSLS